MGWYIGAMEKNGVNETLILKQKEKLKKNSHRAYTSLKPREKVKKS